MECYTYVRASNYIYTFTFAASIPNVQVRLADGDDSLSGRVEVYYNSQWGTICDDEWGFSNSKVICSMLGHGGVIRSYTHGGGSDPIWLDNVNCRGDETSIADCLHEGWAVQDCSHSEDIGVVCSSMQVSIYVYYVV